MSFGTNSCNVLHTCAKVVDMSEMPAAGVVPAWDVADRMRKALRVADVGNQEMADYMGVSRNTVGNYTNGRTAPDRRTLMLWAMRCGVSFEWLATGVGSQGPGDGPDGGGLPHLDSNQEPAGYLYPQVRAA